MGPNWHERGVLQRPLKPGRLKAARKPPRCVLLSRRVWMEAGPAVYTSSDTGEFANQGHRFLSSTSRIVEPLFLFTRPTPTDDRRNHQSQMTSLQES